jgi:hypothetical protein
MNPYLLGAAIYLVLFVAAVLFMFALGRAAAKADRDAERLGLSEPDAGRPGVAASGDARKGRGVQAPTLPGSESSNALGREPGGSSTEGSTRRSNVGSARLPVNEPSRPIHVCGHRVQAVDGKAIHEEWFTADLLARTVGHE